MNEQHDPVFISFADEDQGIADRIAERLRRDGVGVWQYSQRTESGSWHLNELRALRSSRVAIFVITEASAESAACLDEAQRVADPGQLATVPIPLVVGAWDHDASDLWLLLSKWNGVIAGLELTDDALHRLADIVHNGAVLIECAKADALPVLLDGWDEETHAARMKKVEDCLEEALRRYPELTLSEDNFTRLTDRTLQVKPGVEPRDIAEIAAEHGVRFTYSTVHYHFSGSDLDKSTGLDRAMRDHLGLGGLVPSTDVITLGDSFNDAPLFGSGRFAATVGVRGVLEHLEALGEQRPQYVTLGNASEGFVELATTLLER